MTPTQPQPVSYWDVMDAWGHACEARRREEWVMLTEQAERDAVYGRAEVSGGRTLMPSSLMERAVRPCVFLIVAGVAAGVIVAAGRHFGWL